VTTDCITGRKLSSQMVIVWMPAISLPIALIIIGSIMTVLGATGLGIAAYIRASLSTKEEQAIMWVNPAPDLPV
jgi:hypothetical protein